MKKYVIPLAFSALLLAGITACNRSDSSANAPQTDAASQPTNAQGSQPNNSQAGAYQTAERTRRREAMRKQVEAVLTPEQAKQLDSKLQQGEKMRQALSELNLTPEQQTKIREAMKAARANSQQPAQQNSQQSSQ